MDLETFAALQSRTRDELLELVEAVTKQSVTNDQLSKFCEHLTRYVGCDLIVLQPPLPPQFNDQAVDFSNTYGKGLVGDLTKLNTQLGKIYVPLINRLDAERKFLDEKLAPEHHSSHQHLR